MRRGAAAMRGGIVRREGLFSVSKPTFEDVSYSSWQARVEADGASVDRLGTRLPGDVAVQPLYTPERAEGIDRPGVPGTLPYLRGTRSEGAWETGQTYSQVDPRRAARAAAEDRALGVRAPWFQLNPANRTVAPVGADGVLLSSTEDAAQLLTGWDPASGPVYVDAGVCAPALWGALRSHVEARGLAVDSVSGGVLVDPLGILAETGVLPGSLDGAWGAVVGLVRDVAPAASQLRCALVSTCVHHDAGANAVEELAAGIAGGIETLRALEGRGLSIQEAATQIVFRMSIGADVFTEIAKLRAARLLWANVVTRAGGDAAAAAMHLRVRTSWRTRTRRDPWVNMLRATIESFSAAAGGALAIDTLPFDEALGEPTGFSRRVAANTQTILRAESHLGQVQDPAGGSWYVESLTRDLAEKAWAVVQGLEAEGGLSVALGAGTWQARIRTSNETARARVATGRAPVTGVSVFPLLDERSPEREPSTGGEKTAGLQDDSFAQGEALRVEPLSVGRLASAFEELRDRTEGNRPVVFSANLGKLKEHNARSTFARDALATGGIEVVAGDGVDAASVADAFQDSGAKAAVICGTDGRYEEMGTAVVEALRGAGARVVMLAGKPDMAKRCGDAVPLHLRADLPELLSNLIGQIGGDA